MDIFEYQSEKETAPLRPLAERMRPADLGQLVGQDHVVGDKTPIRAALAADRIFSMILWGPPGCGKTTLARIIAKKTRCRFLQISAVLSGVKDIRQVIETARTEKKFHARKTILFVDEIHRFNKSQQDAFLHHVEDGLITLIGATTENPSFEVIPALLSRCRVVTLSPLGEASLETLLARALSDRENGLGEMDLGIETAAISHIVSMSDGDARAALFALEISAMQAASEKSDDPGVISITHVEKALQRRAISHDKNGDKHFNLISAFHKSLRGSDPDAALYWLCRMLAGGENPLYIARRMVRFASEDVGNADPRALSVAMDAMEAYRFLGSPEGDLCLAQAAAYLASAPKSNSIYIAFKKVNDTIEETGGLAVPMHIRNAPTRLMKDMGYGIGYKYAHDYKDAVVAQDHLPEELKGRIFYRPTNRGYEETIAKRLDAWRKMMQKEPE
ncbi:MAG: replication-associated recombination protein A [Deltaproteobacteria bacterium]|nr:replication-associated recombination protein A [Deltaproteobacteria bacterium]